VNITERLFTLIATLFGLSLSDFSQQLMSASADFQAVWHCF